MGDLTVLFIQYLEYQYLQQSNENVNVLSDVFQSWKVHVGWILLGAYNEMWRHHQNTAMDRKVLYTYPGPGTNESRAWLAIYTTTHFCV